MVVTASWRTVMMALGNVLHPFAAMAAAVNPVKNAMMGTR